MADVVYKHKAGDGFVYGVPSRDLTAEDVSRLSAGLLARSVAAGFHTKATPAKKLTTTTQPPKKEADKGGEK